jgi:ribosomal protein S18 acetylase RimI-like enzyme
VSLFSPYEPGRHGEELAAVELRNARPEDVAELTALTLAREGGAPDQVRRGFEREVSGEYPRSIHHLFVAEHAGRAVAFARSRLVTELGPPGPRRPPEGWYLSGVIVRPDLRRRGIGRRLTAARIEDLRGVARELYCVVNARNRASIDLHAAFGFEELTRAFDYPRVTFAGGEGVLFRLRLS